VAGILCRAVPAAALPFPPQMRASLAGYAGTFDLIQHPVRADAQPPVGTADERSQRSRIGTDPLTGREIRFRKTCKTEQAAQIELGRLLAQAAAGRQPDSAATVAQLLDQYVSTAGCGVSTRKSNLGYIRRTIKPALGSLGSSSNLPICQYGRSPGGLKSVGFAYVRFKRRS